MWTALRQPYGGRTGCDDDECDEELVSEKTLRKLLFAFAVESLIYTQDMEPIRHVRLQRVPLGHSKHVRKLLWACYWMQLYRLK